jgi:NAD(P)-dependent dehydrogenase (short-subunit alcohol dehydrogenase family)
MKGAFTMTNGMNVADKTVLTIVPRDIGRTLVNEALEPGTKRIFAAAGGPLHVADAGVIPLTDAVEQHVAVNLPGPLRMTNEFVPPLKRCQRAIVNSLSLALLAALPMIPAYSISKAAVFNMTQSLRALLAAEGVSVRISRVIEQGSESARIDLSEDGHPASCFRLRRGLTGTGAAPEGQSSGRSEVCAGGRNGTIGL